MLPYPICRAWYNGSYPMTAKFMNCIIRRSSNTFLIIFIIYTPMFYWKIHQLVKFNCIQDSGGVFSISSLVKISIISLISRLPLKLHLNYIHRCMIKESSGLPRKSSAILVNVRCRSCDLRTRFRVSSDSLRKARRRKSSENRQMRCHQ